MAFLYMVQCDGCRATEFTYTPTDPDALLKCAPDSGCCQLDHHHGEAANACPEDHEHGFGVPGCTSCRPITITALPGSNAVSMTGEGGG